MIERKIMRDNSGEHTRLACWFWRPAKTNFQKIVLLLRINRVIPNRSDKAVARLFPMKNLPGIKRHCEIEIRRANRDHIREDNDE
jgi:hypothetical protein